MGTPARASQTNWKLGLHYTCQAQPGWVGEYGTSEPEWSPFPGILTAASISQIINATLLQVYSISRCHFQVLAKGIMSQTHREQIRPRPNHLWRSCAPTSARSPHCAYRIRITMTPWTVVLHHGDDTVSEYVNKFPFQFTKTQYWKEIKDLWRYVVCVLPVFERNIFAVELLLL